jgi:hypothetical protein
MRILSFLIILLFISCNPSAPAEQAENPTPTVIGYEINDENKTIDILAGDMASTAIVKAFFGAYNNADLETVKTMEHEDVIYYTPSGAVIEGRDAHLEMAKEFFAANESPHWKIKWSMSGSVNFESKDVENWVTSGVEMSYGPDSARTTVNRVVDLMIVEGMVKKGYVYQRIPAESEKK